MESSIESTCAVLGTILSGIDYDFTSLKKDRDKERDRRVKEILSPRKLKLVRNRTDKQSYEFERYKKPKHKAMKFKKFHSDSSLYEAPDDNIVGQYTRLDLTPDSQIEERSRYSHHTSESSHKAYSNIPTSSYNNQPQLYIQRNPGNISQNLAKISSPHAFNEGSQTHLQAAPPSYEIVRQATVPVYESQSLTEFETRSQIRQSNEFDVQNQIHTNPQPYSVNSSPEKAFQRRPPLPNHQIPNHYYKNHDRNMDEWTYQSRTQNDKFGKLVMFFRNGDSNYKGLRTCINRKDFPQLETLLVWLNEKITTSTGVRHIFRLPDGKEIKDINDFEPQKSYVVSSTPKLKRSAIYGISKEDYWKNDKPSAGKFRRGEGKYFREDPDKKPSHDQSVVYSPPNAKPRNLTIISNSDRYSRLKIILNPKTPQTFEDLLKDFTNMIIVEKPPIQSLWTANEPLRRVNGYAQLFREFKNQDAFIACGTEMKPYEVLYKEGGMNLDSSRMSHHSEGKDLQGGGRSGPYPHVNPKSHRSEQSPDRSNTQRQRGGPGARRGNPHSKRDGSPGNRQGDHGSGGTDRSRNGGTPPPYVLQTNPSPRGSVRNGDHDSVRSNQSDDGANEYIDPKRYKGDKDNQPQNGSGPTDRNRGRPGNKSHRSEADMIRVDIHGKKRELLTNGEESDERIWQAAQRNSYSRIFQRKKRLKKNLFNNETPREPPIAKENSANAPLTRGIHIKTLKKTNQRKDGDISKSHHTLKHIDQSLAPVINRPIMKSAKEADVPKLDVSCENLKDITDEKTGRVVTKNYADSSGRLADVLLLTQRKKMKNKTKKRFVKKTKLIVKQGLQCICPSEPNVRFGKPFRKSAQKYKTCRHCFPRADDFEEIDDGGYYEEIEVNETGPFMTESLSKEVVNNGHLNNGEAETKSDNNKNNNKDKNKPTNNEEAIERSKTEPLPITKEDKEHDNLCHCNTHPSVTCRVNSKSLVPKDLCRCRKCQLKQKICE